VNSSLIAKHDRVLCFAINNFGTGEHPSAEVHNLQWFVDEYLVCCLQRMVASNRVTEAGHSAAWAALADLGAGPG
jgi:hypothetical protein